MVRHPFTRGIFCIFQIISRFSIETNTGIPSIENNNTAFSIDRNVRMSINGDQPTLSMPNSESNMRRNQSDPRIPANNRIRSNRSSFDAIEDLDVSSDSSDLSDTEGSEYSETGDGSTELEILRKKYALARDQIAQLVIEKEQRNFDLISVLKHNKETRMILKMQRELLEDCFLSHNPNTQFDSNLFNWMDSTISQIILNQNAGWNDEMSISETNATVQKLKSNDLTNLPIAQAMHFNRNSFESNVQVILQNLSAQRHQTNRNQYQNQ